MSDFDPKTAPHIPDWVAFRLDMLHQISSTVYMLAAIAQDIMEAGEGEEGGPNMAKLQGIITAIKFLKSEEIELEALDPFFLEKLKVRADAEFEMRQGRGA